MILFMQNTLATKSNQVRQSGVIMHKAAQAYVSDDRRSQLSDENDEKTPMQVPQIKLICLHVHVMKCRTVISHMSPQDGAASHQHAVPDESEFGIQFPNDYAALTVVTDAVKSKVSKIRLITQLHAGL